MRIIALFRSIGKAALLAGIALPLANAAPINRKLEVRLSDGEVLKAAEVFALTHQGIFVGSGMVQYCLTPEDLSAFTRMKNKPQISAYNEELRNYLLRRGENVDPLPSISELEKASVGVRGNAWRDRVNRLNEKTYAFWRRSPSVSIKTFTIDEFGRLKQRWPIVNFADISFAAAKEYRNIWERINPARLDADENPMAVDRFKRLRLITEVLPGQEVAKYFPDQSDNKAMWVSGFFAPNGKDLILAELNCRMFQGQILLFEEDCDNVWDNEKIRAAQTIRRNFRKNTQSQLRSYPGRPLSVEGDYCFYGIQIGEARRSQTQYSNATGNNLVSVQKTYTLTEQMIDSRLRQGYKISTLSVSYGLNNRSISHAIIYEKASGNLQKGMTSTEEILTLVTGFLGNPWRGDDLQQLELNNLLCMMIDAAARHYYNIHDNGHNTELPRMADVKVYVNDREIMWLVIGDDKNTPQTDEIVVFSIAPAGNSYQFSMRLFSRKFFAVNALTRNYKLIKSIPLNSLLVVKSEPRKKAVATSKDAAENGGAVVP